MHGLTEDGRRTVEAIAGRHGVSGEAVAMLLAALAAGGGRQAQFNIAELGGMGQWSQGGMTMVGDMFNNGLKYRVDALCSELATVLAERSPFTPTPFASQHQRQSSGASLLVPGGAGNRWPAELGAPASTGSQNDLHYAVFPDTHRLAIAQGGRVTVYDIGDHRIGGFSQQQSGDQSVTFTSQHGMVRLADLAIVDAAAGAAPPEAAKRAAPPRTFDPVSAPLAPVDRSPARPAQSDEEIFAKLERLAEIRDKNIITAAEFDAKKSELLARL